MKNQRCPNCRSKLYPLLIQGAIARTIGSGCTKCGFVELKGKFKMKGDEHSILG